MHLPDNIIAYIDLAALRHNISVIKYRVAGCSILAMVKSNAYGHGAIEVAKTLEAEVGAFAVASLNEALHLHEAGIKKPIVILVGFFSSDELKIIDQHRFETIIHDQQQIEILKKTKLQNKLSVWLKIDTGFHRLGFPPKQVHKVYKVLCDTEKVAMQIKFITHFSDADDLGKSKTSEQLRCFNDAILDLAGEKSLANSAGILYWPAACNGWVRPGILLYGVSPIAGKTGSDLGFKPVMTLASRLIAIHELKRGDTVGYGSAWACPEAMRVGVVAIGYSGGYMRSIKTGAPVLVNGIICPLIGCISMEMITVDLRPNAEAKIGDEVILWGRGLPVETIAEYAGTIPYELLVHVAQARYHY